MAIIAAAQFTIRDANDIIAQATEPSDKNVGLLWLDTSTDPYQLKMWNGSTWEIVNDPEYLEIALGDLNDALGELNDALGDLSDIEYDDLITYVKTIDANVLVNEEAIEINHTTITNVENVLTGVQTQVSKVDSRVTINEDGIENLVTKTDEQGTRITEVSQQADRIDLIVTSESDESSVSLTESAMEFISENVEIDAGRIDLNANESFTSTVGEVDALQTRIKQTEDALTGYVKQDELEVYIRLDADSKGVEIGTNDSEFFTHTKNTGFFIKHREDDGMDKTVGMFNYKGLETNELALGVDPDRTSERKIVARATTSGGWIWVLD